MHTEAQDERDFGRPEALALFARLARSEYDIIRLKSVQALRDLQASEQIAVLIAALHDDDEDVRVDAVEALGLLGNREAIPHLLENLTYDPCGEVKLGCIKALSALDAREMIPLLRGLVTGRAASDSIVWDEDEYHQGEWDDWLDIQIAAIIALGRFGDVEAISPIVTAVQDDESQDLGPVAMEALGQIGEASLPTLGMFLQSSRRRLRYQAARALTQFPGEKAEQLLRKTLDDDDAATRRLAYEALIQAGQQDIIERALTDADDNIRILALARFNLDDETLLARVLNDPSPHVQLALIERFDGTLPCETEEDMRFKVLDCLKRSGNQEVSASALGALASLAPALMTGDLAELFEVGQTPSENLERRQWSVVDCLARSQKPEAAEWLQRACSSDFRAVRLKALAHVGRLSTEEGISPVQRQQAQELLLSLALPPLVQAPETEEPDVQETETGVAEMQAGEGETETSEPLDGRARLKAAGLDIGDEADQQAEGPTSSLGAILGHEAIAEDLTKEVAAEENLEALTSSEQTLLNRARRNLTKRRVAVDGDEGALNREVRLTAIQLLGEQPHLQDNLADLVLMDDRDIKAAAQAGLLRHIQTFGLQISAERLLEILTHGLAATDHTIRLGALRLVRYAPERPDQLASLIRMALKDGDAHVRIEALRAKLALDGDLKPVIAMLSDPSAMVRQRAMRLLSRKDAALASEHVLDFIMENPEQSITAYLVRDEKMQAKAGACLADKLQDEEARAAWPIILPALASLYQSGQARGAVA